MSDKQLDKDIDNLIKSLVKNPDETIYKLNKAIDAGKGNLSMYISIGRALVKRGYKDEVYRIYLKYIKKYPEKSFLIFEEFVNDSNDFAIVKWYNFVVDKFGATSPEISFLDYTLGKAHFDKGELEKASPYILKAAYHFNTGMDNELHELGIYDMTTDIISYFENNLMYNQAIELMREWVYLDYGQEFCYGFVERILELKEKQMLAGQENDILVAKVAERDKVIADLSHSIKNLISTVSDPLENLKDTGSFNPQIVENALVGTNLIRGIVNAMNLSYAGSIDDFYYDSKHSADNDAVSIDSIIIDAIVNSVSNIFSPKYFDVYKRNFFPTKKEYEVARSEWSKIIPITDRNSLLEYLNEYFFAFDISFYGTSKLAIGDTRGSSTKLMILFQELILNAVKYSSFVPRNRREVKIRASRRKGNLQFQVSNSHKPNQQSKTSGIGHIIVENFTKLLKISPSYRIGTNNYQIGINLPNLWRK